jgi:hypothetical protein
LKHFRANKIKEVQNSKSTTVTLKAKEMERERKLTAEKMQDIITKDALQLISEWRNHPYEKEPSVEYYDILNHLRDLMKKLQMDKEENLIAHVYGKEILNKKTATPEYPENIIF